MGTRADFYIGRGEKAEWLGSIAMDGYPTGLNLSEGCAAVPTECPVLMAANEQEYRERVTELFHSRRDATLPENGWPWPWEDSRTTDYAYAFDGGKVWASCFGYSWFDPLEEERDDEESTKTAVFPKMDTVNHAQAGTRRSGVMVIGL